jgi:AcrR family transcriptional regulator
MTERRQKTDVRQRQIVSAARRLIVKYGSEHVTVRRVAKEIGVSEGAIYRHFKSKRDVLSLLIDDVENTLIGDIEDSYKPGTSVLDTLEKVILSDVSSIEQRKGVSFQVIAEIVSLGDKRLSSKAYDVISEYIERIRGILSEGVKSGVVRQDIDLDAAATLLFSIIQGLVNIWALSRYSFNLVFAVLTIAKVNYRLTFRCPDFKSFTNWHTQERLTGI